MTEFREREIIYGTSILHYELVPVERIVSSHDINSQYVRKVAGKLKAGGTVRPIALQEATLRLIDGHHRLAALKRLGYRKAPAHIFDYDNCHLVLIEVGGIRYECSSEDVKECVLTETNDPIGNSEPLPEPVFRYLMKEIQLAELA